LSNPISQAQAAHTSPALMAWEDMPDGSRKRWWCKACRNEGWEWLTPTPCKHVETADPEVNIPKQEAIATLLSFMNEPNSLASAESR